METQEKKMSVYEITTQHVISLLSSGIIPWHVSWAESGIPRNAITLKPYRGPNVPLLAAGGYPYNFFITEDQLSNMGSKVLKDEWPHKALYWEWRDDVNGGNEKFAALQYEKVYNIGQCEGISFKSLLQKEEPGNPLIVCRDIIKNMDNAPHIEYGSELEEYRAADDVVMIPASTDYTSPELYYFDLFRMLIYATGHPSRLARKEQLVQEPIFSREELIADMGAHYLCFYAGITGALTLPDPGYIYAWIERLSNDPKLFVSLATQMQKAVDLILKPKEQEAPEQKPTVEEEKEPFEDNQEKPKKKRTRKNTAKAVHG